ncbi:tripartite motif-containing protein 67 [Trichonephila clavipes]|nr:tripartite motif-containing protein 67 [Trichonephila clavipes]
MKPYHDPAEQIETEDIPPKESYKGPITRSRIKALEQNDSGRCLLFEGSNATHNLLQVPIAELAERWTELPQVSGKDDKGWGMYIDHQRSWFLHADSHESRTEGGIEVGSVIGILLDLEQHQLSFYVNDERQGPIAFTDLHGVFFPAFSVNRNVQITIQTALEPPPGAGLDISSCKDSLSQLSLSTTLSPTHKLQV